LNVTILWCDSVNGKVCYRAEDSIPVKYDVRSLGEGISLCSAPEEVFDILRERDGQLVAIDYNKLGEVLGWT